MTREEQIRQGIVKHYGELGLQSGMIKEAFINGAKWADNHPKNDVYRDANDDIISLEELERRYNQGIEYHKQKLIDKVCTYLEMRLDEYIIRDLRKAMEE